MIDQENESIKNFEPSREKLKREKLKLTIQDQDITDITFNNFTLEDVKNSRLNILEKRFDKLNKQIEISENLKDLTLQAVKDKRNYYVYIFMIIFLLIMLSNYSYKYGTEIIKEIHKMDTRTSSDYFGFFLMKMPFSLIIIAFISGAFIFINKLLFIIERINNQLRNFSKISVIASQMDKTYIDLIKNGNFSNKSEAEQNAHKEAEQKDLFYKLITNYLVSLSKNEADLADSKKEPLLKQVKQIAGIVKEFNFNKDK